MQVLIVNANRCTRPTPVMPLGACLVAEAAERAKHDVRFLDMTFQRDPAAALQTELTKYHPAVVGVSLRNIDNNDILDPQGYIDEAAELVKSIRSSSRGRVVLGGAAMGVMPEQIIRQTQASLGVLGDGEIVFPKVLDVLARGKYPSATPGVVHWEDGHIKMNRLPPNLGIGHCTAENFKRWINVKAYLSRMAAVPIQTKKGCPFECVYCTYSAVEGKEYRLHKSEDVVENIRRLAKQGLRDIEFVDNVFNSPYEHAVDICSALVAAKLKVRLQSVELNPRFLDDSLLTLMERAGFVGAGITAESASDVVLANLQKEFSSEDLRKTAELLCKRKLPILWIFMFGGPGESAETVEETIRFTETFLRPQDVAFFSMGIRIYPGTRLERIARQQGVLQTSAEDMLTPAFYVSPEISLEALRHRLQLAAANRQNIVLHESMGLPLMQKVLAVSHALGMRPPLWRHTRKVRRALKWMRMHP